MLNMENNFEWYDYQKKSDVNQAFFFKEEICLIDSLILSDFFYWSKWISDRLLTFVMSGSFSGE